MNILKKSGLAVVMGVLAFSVFTSNVVKAEVNPFATQSLVTYTNESEGKCGEGKMKAKAEEKMKGKCGESKMKGKCGEGKMKTKAHEKMEGKCGESKMKGKCGEGKMKAKAHEKMEGKCGG